MKIEKIEKIPTLWEWILLLSVIVALVAITNLLIYTHNACTFDKKVQGFRAQWQNVIAADKNNNQFEEIEEEVARLQFDSIEYTTNYINFYQGNALIYKQMRYGE